MDEHFGESARASMHWDAGGASHKHQGTRWQPCNLTSTPPKRPKTPNTAALPLPFSELDFATEYCSPLRCWQSSEDPWWPLEDEREEEDTQLHAELRIAVQRLVTSVELRQQAALRKHGLIGPTPSPAMPCSPTNK